MDYVKQKEEGKDLENFQGGHGCMKQEKTEENPNTKGLALLINKNFTDYVESFEKHSHRIILCKIKLHRKTSLQIIQVYAPTSDHDIETVELFYEELEKAIDKKACSHHIVMGNFKANTGVRNINDNEMHRKTTQTESSHAKLNYTEKYHYKSYKSMPQHATTTSKQ